jgi:hypothetical protein
VGWWLGQRGHTLVHVESEQMPLSGGFYQPFPSRAKNVAAVERYLPEQFLNRLFVLLHGLIVDFRGFIERGFEVLNLLSEPTQQVVTLLRISRP